MPRRRSSFLRGFYAESLHFLAWKRRAADAGSLCRREYQPEDPATAGAEPTGETQGNCALLRLGPRLLDPPLTEESETSFEADIPAGTYRRIRLQIHKPTGSGAAEFLADNPDLSDVSVRVVGTFNGTDFVFISALTVEEEIVLEEPLVVEAGGSTPLTLVLYVKTWFLNQAGDALIDPAAAADGQLKSRIEQNIRTSFKAQVE